MLICLTGCTSRRSFDDVYYRGVYAEYQIENVSEYEITEFEEKLNNYIDFIRCLLKEKGFIKSNVMKNGPDRIRIEIPDIYDSSGILEIIGEPTTIRFVLDRTNEIVITGENVVDASAGYDTQSGYVVRLCLDIDGRRKFSEATTDHIGETMSIYLGDSTTPVSSPTINSAITNGEAIITGFASQAEAEGLANKIISGANSTGLIITLVEYDVTDCIMIK